jgi:two-component system response regulator YesN
MYIKKQITGAVSLQKIAEYVHLAPGYLSRLFKERTGDTVSSFIARCRVERAAELLEGRNMRVYEVCAAVGYSDLKHFYSIFKKHFGCTPNEYRKRLRETR